MNKTVSFVDAVKANTPMPVRRISRHMKQWMKDRRNNRAPAKEVFTEIYAKHLWGAEGAMNFYSGPGSGSSAAQPYSEFVKRFIVSHHIDSVVDLGCGDFRVGSLIAPSCTRYTGVDIVDALIADNRRHHGSSRVFFECLDIASDNLPEADLCLVREVLQHLSNTQIKSILARVSIYRYVLITDVQPTETSGYRINRDKIHGDSSRILHRSVLQLDKAPFNVANVTQVFETDAQFHSSYAPYGSSFKLRTFLLRP
jgi:SAM-dependent methyltransferase